MKEDAFDRLREQIQAEVPLTDDEFEIVKSKFVLRSFKKHQFLVQKGEPVRNDHWVVSGLLKAYFTDDNAKEHILQFAMEDWWITDFQAYFNKTPATIWVDCVEPSVVFSLSIDARETLCREIHKMSDFFRIKGNKGYVALQQRILSLLSSNADERYHQLLNQYPKLFQRVPKTLIAAYLGVSRETLSRLNAR